MARRRRKRTPQKKTKYTDAQRERFYSALADGKTNREAAEAAGVHRATASAWAARWRRERGIIHPQHPHRQQAEADLMAAAKAEVEVDAQPASPPSPPPCAEVLPAIQSTLQGLLDVQQEMLARQSDMLAAQNALHEMLANGIRIAPAALPQTNGTNGTHRAAAVVKPKQIDTPKSEQPIRTTAMNFFETADDDLDEVLSDDHLALLPEISECVLSGWDEYAVADEFDGLTAADVNRIQATAEFKAVHAETKRKLGV